MFILHDRTKGQSWEYETERGLMNVATLYVISHPTSTVEVTINGRTGTVTRRKPAMPVANPTEA